jgi:hypothetical protein
MGELEFPLFSDQLDDDASTWGAFRFLHSKDQQGDWRVVELGKKVNMSLLLSFLLCLYYCAYFGCHDVMPELRTIQAREK